MSLRAATLYEASEVRLFVFKVNGMRILESQFEWCFEQRGVHTKESIDSNTMTRKKQAELIEVCTI